MTLTTEAIRTHALEQLKAPNSDLNQTIGDLVKYSHFDSGNYKVNILINKFLSDLGANSGFVLFFKKRMIRAVLGEVFYLKKIQTFKSGQGDTLTADFPIIRSLPEHFDLTLTENLDDVEQPSTQMEKLEKAWKRAVSATQKQARDCERNYGAALTLLQREWGVTEADLREMCATLKEGRPYADSYLKYVACHAAFVDPASAFLFKCGIRDCSDEKLASLTQVIEGTLTPRFSNRDKNAVRDRKTILALANNGPAIHKLLTQYKHKLSAPQRALLETTQKSPLVAFRLPQMVWPTANALERITNKSFAKCEKAGIEGLKKLKLDNKRLGPVDISFKQASGEKVLLPEKAIFQFVRSVRKFHDDPDLQNLIHYQLSQEGFGWRFTDAFMFSNENVHYDFFNNKMEIVVEEIGKDKIVVHYKTEAQIVKKNEEGQNISTNCFGKCAFHYSSTLSRKSSGHRWKVLSTFDRNKSFISFDHKKNEPFTVGKWNRTFLDIIEQSANEI